MSRPPRPDSGKSPSGIPGAVQTVTWRCSTGRAGSSTTSPMGPWSGSRTAPGTTGAPERAWLAERCGGVLWICGRVLRTGASPSGRVDGAPGAAHALPGAPSTLSRLSPTSSTGPTTSPSVPWTPVACGRPAVGSPRAPAGAAVVDFSPCMDTLGRRSNATIRRGRQKMAMKEALPGQPIRGRDVTRPMPRDDRHRLGP